MSTSVHAYTCVLGYNDLEVYNCLLLWYVNGQLLANKLFISVDK